MGARLLAEEDLSDDKILSIKKEIEAMSKKRQKNGKISYKACLNYVSATKWNKKMVGLTGIEPVTPSMSTKCSPAEL